jgi:hypothetical protein
MNESRKRKETLEDNENDTDMPHVKKQMQSKPGLLLKDSKESGNVFAITPDQTPI